MFPGLFPSSPLHLYAQSRSVLWGREVYRRKSGSTSGSISRKRIHLSQPGSCIAAWMRLCVCVGGNTCGQHLPEEETRAPALTAWGAHAARCPQPTPQPRAGCAALIAMFILILFNTLKIMNYRTVFHRLTCVWAHSTGLLSARWSSHWLTDTDVHQPARAQLQALAYNHHYRWLYI